MTRDEIRATIEGLERLTTDECLCGDDRAIVRAALTLLRVMGICGQGEADTTATMVFETFEEIDRERKAVQS